jgi:hypothetical protein
VEIRDVSDLPPFDMMRVGGAGGERHRRRSGEDQERRGWLGQSAMPCWTMNTATSLQSMRGEGGISRQPLAALLTKGWKSAAAMRGNNGAALSLTQCDDGKPTNETKEWSWMRREEDEEDGERHDVRQLPSSLLPHCGAASVSGR